MKRKKGEAPKAELSESAAPKVEKAKVEEAPATEHVTKVADKPKVKLTYKDQRELSNLPAKIENTEAEIAALSEKQMRKRSWNVMRRAG